MPKERKCLTPVRGMAHFMDFTRRVALCISLLTDDDTDWYSAVAFITSEAHASRQFGARCRTLGARLQTLTEIRSIYHRASTVEYVRHDAACLAMVIFTQHHYLTISPHLM